MKKEKYDEIWNDILDSLETKPIELWDYETMDTDVFDFHFYWVHLVQLKKMHP